MADHEQRVARLAAMFPEVDASTLRMVLESQGWSVQASASFLLDAPPNVAIASAYIQFTVDETTSEATNLEVRVELEDDPPTFSSTHTISTRTLSDEAVVWSPPAWNTVGESGEAQRTPELRSLVQTIIDRPGWARGNAIVFVISGTGKRVAESYDGSTSQAPRL